MAITIHQEGKFEEALVLYKNILKNYPNNYTLLSNIGACYLGLKNGEQAKQHLYHAINFQQPDSLMMYRIGRAHMYSNEWETAAKWMQQALESGYPSAFLTLFELGSNYYFAGIHKEAQEFLYNAHLLDTTHAGALNNLAWSYLETEPKQSCVFFQKAYHLDSLDPRNVNNLGYAKLLAGYHEEALNLFLQTKKMDPKNAFVYRNLGLYYKTKENKKKAKKNLQLAIKYGILEKWGKENGEKYIAELKNYCNQ
jgi:tetratricopeptide (TPR) repeat protein